RTLQGELPGRAVQKVPAAHHIGHALQRIVHHHRQLVGERAVAAPDDDIPALAQREAADPLRPILEGHDAVFDPAARRGGSAAPGAVAARPRITALGALAARATALEGEAELGESLLRARVVFCAGALVLDGA